MFPTQPHDFTSLVDRPLPDFRRTPWIEGPQLAVLPGWFLLSAGAIIVNFHRGETLWEIEYTAGVPVYAPIFLLIAHLSLALAVWRCYWPLWLTGFAGTITFALLFAFLYLPLMRPPLPALLPPVAPQAEAAPVVPDAPDGMFFCQEEGDEPAPPQAPLPNRGWGLVRPAFGGLFLLLGPLPLYLAAAWAAVNSYRRSTSP